MRRENTKKKGKLLKRKALSSDEISLQSIKAWSDTDPKSEPKGQERSPMQMISLINCSLIIPSQPMCKDKG